MDKKQAIQDFFTDFSLETTPRTAKRVSDYRQLIRQGEKVYITFLPDSDFSDTIDIAIRLKKEGFEPVPHIAARSIPNKHFLENAIKRCVEEAGVEQVLMIAGAVDNPIGDFHSTAQLLETGLIDKYGIKSVGFAGHPEGNPDISDTLIQQALEFKNNFDQRSDANCYLVTQFCFEAKPIIAWDNAIRASGNHLPIHIGIPGLATLKSLIMHSQACGIGVSIRFLTKQARNISKLLLINTPDKLCADLAIHKASNTDCGITGMHFYPLGGLQRTAQWAYAIRDGKFTITDENKINLNHTITNE